MRSEKLSEGGTMSKWAMITLVTLMLCLTAIMIVVSIEVNKTQRIAFELGYSNTIGWRK